jgi:hypothetical protein
MRRKIVCSGRSVCSRKGSPAAASTIWSMRRSSVLNSASVKPVAALAQQALHMQHLVAMRRACPLGGEPDDEALDVAAQLQKHALARQVDRRDLQAVTRADDDQRVGGEPVDRVMHRRAAEAGHVLQILHGEEAAGRELAGHEQLLDALIGQLEQVDAVAARQRVLPSTSISFGRLARLAIPRISSRRNSFERLQLEADHKHVVIFYKHSYCRRSLAFAARARLGRDSNQSRRSTIASRRRAPAAMGGRP